MELEKIIRFERGYDCIRFECINDSPNCYSGSGGSHGIHGLSIRFTLKGDEGAVQFLMSTGWLPQSVKPNSIDTLDFKIKDSSPYASDLGYHSKTPMYKGHQSIQDDCEFCDGQPCYYDGSGLNANDAFYTLVNGGDEALWKFLEGYYQYTFKEERNYPAVGEYLKPIRETITESEATDV